MTINKDILSSLKSNQKNAIRSYAIFASLLVILGLIFIFVSIFLINQSETIKLFIGIGGGFISTISAFPINEIITRIERIKTYEFLSNKIQDMNKSELKKIEELIWKSLEKII